MPRDLPLGNGSLLVAFDSAYQIRDLYFHHVGQENHAMGHRFRFGVWVDGDFRWSDDPRWERDLRYAHETLVSNVRLTHADLNLTLKSPTLRAERIARGPEENPIKVGIATNLKEVRDDSRFLTAGPARVILFTTQQTSPAQIARLRRRGAQVFVRGEHRVDLPEVLRYLKMIGIERVLVGGGSTLNAELLRQRLVDEIYLYIAPLIFTGATVPTLADGTGLTREEAIQLELRSVETFDEGGVVLHYVVVQH